MSVPDISTVLCGNDRPGHFDGVTSVVCRLFNIVQPGIAVFGQKDYQQLVVIRRMVADLHLPIKIVAGQTHRESDGLASSSRNRYLTDEQRAIAPHALCSDQSVPRSGTGRRKGFGGFGSRRTEVSQGGGIRDGITLLCVRPVICLYPIRTVAIS